MTGPILVTLDGSLFSKNAANEAILIAQQQGLSIRGYYIVDEEVILNPYANYHLEFGSPSPPSYAIPTAQNELVDWFERQGSNALTWLEDRCKEAGVKATNELVLGGIPELIIKEAESASLLALGLRGLGRRGESDHLGRNFRIIAHHTHQPMLVCSTEVTPLRNLLLAYNGSKRAENALEWAAGLQKSFYSNVVVVPVQEGEAASDEWISQIESRLRESGLNDYRLIHRHGHPAAEIIAVAEENHSDLILMGGYRHTALVEWLVGSTVDRVLHSTQLPVLIG